MSRKVPLRQSDVSRVLRALKAAGVFARVEVDAATGDLSIIPYDGALAPDDDGLAKWEAASQPT